MVSWYSCAKLHAAHLVRRVNVGASTCCCYRLGLAFRLKRLKKRRQLQGSSEAGHTERTLDWSLVVKGWNCMRGTDPQSVQGSD